MSGELLYDPRVIGTGPYTLTKIDATTAGPITHHPAYIEAKNLSWRDTPGGKTGHFKDESGEADDTIIPEFVDSAYSAPMPILYLRATRGANVIITSASPNKSEYNQVITYDPTNSSNRVGQYDLHQILAYTGTGPTGGSGTPIGEGRKVPKPSEVDGWATKPVPPPHGLWASVADGIEVNALPHQPDPNTESGLLYFYPFNPYCYFRNYALSGAQNSNKGLPRNDVPQQKDGYILISAGPDRIYGTRDDITNFGGVGQ
jgi:hypothetical protein